MSVSGSSVAGSGFSPSVLGKSFSKIETFGQYPLQVNGYKNLHECLEGAMVEGETGPSPSDQSVKYGQEVSFAKSWFSCSQ